ncbi:MAG TPA: DUF2203 domain-containing protein [Candidatus Nanoarchaeia archaeon]|nr:DUF2203 domain-containing protein [Candidatus Nanoarchaeia archaeon]
MKRHYTLAQANALLPKIRPAIEQMIALHMKLAQLNEIDIEYEDPFRDMQQAIQDALVWSKVQYEFHAAMKELADLGIFIKDPSIGLLDFFARHEGREIFLCYCYPEKDIRFYHELDGGYEGRKPVDLLLEQTK